MSTEMENAKELVERQVRVTQTKNIQVYDDGSNEAAIPGFPYRFKACGDHILVAVDVFKSGYECKECKGKGEMKVKCVCDGSSRPGFKYDQRQVDEYAQTLGPDQADGRALMKCSSCQGDYESQRKVIPCAECGGKGALLHLADQSKALPTTGVIVSLGARVNKGEDVFHVHDRVLFGAFTGVMIPTKAPGVVFKVMREHEVLCTIKGGEDMAVFDFVTIDTDLK